MPCSPLLNALLQKNLIRVFWLFITASLLTACGGGGDPSVPDNLDDIGGGEASISITIVDGGTTGRILSQGTDATNTIQVTLSSTENIENEVVTLSSTIGTVSGTGSQLTDSTGLATFNIQLNGSSEGDAGVLTASYTNNFGNTVSTTLNVQAGEEIAGGESALSITLENGGDNGRTLTQGSSVTNTVLVTLSNSSGSIDGQAITLTSTLGTITGNGQQLTDTNGLARFGIVLTGAVEGNAGTITAEYSDSSGDSATQSISVEAGPIDGDTTIPTDGPQLTAQFTNGSTTLSTTAANPIRVTLLEDDGTPFDTPQIVTLTSSVGEITPSSGTVLTDTTTGNASAQIDVSGLDEGTAGTITISFTTSDDVTLTETLNFEAGENTAADEIVHLLEARLYDRSEYQNDPSNAIETDSSNITRPNTSASALTQINAIQPATLEVWYTIDGVPQPNVLVNVASTLAELSPTSGNILTNELGVATLALSVGNAESGEAGTISVSAGEVEAEAVTFSIGSSNLALGNGSGATFSEGILTIGDDELSPSGSTGITVNIVNSAQSSELYDQSLEINFTSECVELGLAELDTPVTTASGTAETTYTANGCEEDTIVATITSIDGPSASGTLTVESSSPSSIAFVSSTPETISLRGTGGAGRLESAEVTFQIIDNTGTPEAGVSVSFALSTETGGVSLVETTALSDSDGNVVARVDSGNVPTPLRVLVTVDGTNISTVSDILTISTGLPDQNSFTVSTDVLNPGGGDQIGVTATISVSAADIFGNPVPDGTAINFITEFGRVEPSCTTTGGNCSATWNSQNPYTLSYQAATLATDCYQEVDNDGVIDVTTGIPCRISSDSGFDLNGDGAIDSPQGPDGAITTVLAYAIGEESFNDTNGNGLFDQEESFVDANGNGVYDAPEQFVDLDGDGEHDNEQFVDTDGDGIYDIVELFTDTNGNGVYDVAETFTDTNANSQYDEAEEFNDLNGDGSYNFAETFTDANGNGEYDLGETFNDLNGDTFYTFAEPFTDSNNNDQYDIAEPFVDSNGNGIYDEAEPFVDADRDGNYNAIAEAFTDDNGNGVYDNEPLFDRNGNGIFDDGEDFTDENGNGIHDNEFDITLNDLSEAFLDHDDDNKFKASTGVTDDSGELADTDEVFIDYDSNSLFDTGNNIYNGSLCSDSLQTAGNCSQDLSHVYGSARIRMSSRLISYSIYNSEDNLVAADNLAGIPVSINPNAPTPNIITGGTSVDVSDGSQASFTVYLADEKNGPLPAGTEIQVTSTNCQVDFPIGTIVTTDKLSGFDIFNISLSEDESADNNTGTVSITITTPSTNNLLGSEVELGVISCRDLN